MCPMCIATAAVTWIAAGAASTGLAVLAVRGIRRRTKTRAAR